MLVRARLPRLRVDLTCSSLRPAVRRIGGDGDVQGLVHELRGYFSTDESGTLEGANLVCSRAGFQAQVYSPNGNVVATYCPLARWRKA